MRRLVEAFSEKVCVPQSVVVVEVMLPKASKTVVWVLGMPLARMLPVTSRLTLSYTNVWLPIALTLPAPSYPNGVRVRLLAGGAGGGDAGDALDAVGVEAVGRDDAVGVGDLVRHGVDRIGDARGVRRHAR